MRTFSGFLLLQDILDFLPTSNTTLVNFSADITSPMVKVIEADCFTTVGTYITINYEIEGRIELATGLSIDKSRIDQLLSQGIYKVAVRDLFSCISTGGICQQCYHGSNIDLPTPVVGSMLRIPPLYNIQNDVFVSNGLNAVFTLSQDSTTYTKALVIIGGAIQNGNYIISGTTLTFNSPPSAGTHIVIRYYNQTTKPFMGYLAKTYTGSLLGMSVLPTQNLQVRTSLIQDSITEDKLNLATHEIQTQYKTITSNYLDYISKIKDPLERGLYLSVLYGIYANVST